jgi:hypothetical protein
MHELNDIGNIDMCTVPAAHLLHIDIECSTKSDAAVKDVARKLRADVLFWTRQLLFESDPAQAQDLQNGTIYAVVMEVDTRHTAKTLLSSVDTKALRQLSGEHITSALVRIFSLEGSARYHDVTPKDAKEAPIDNRTYDDALDGNRSSEPAYFGLSPNAWVHT